MKFVLYTNSISAHQLPLARAIVRRIGAENFRYVYTGRTQGGGQEIAASEPWIASEDETTDALLRQCDVLLSGNRAIDVFEDRTAHGKLTLYMSERWFKPIRVMRNVWAPGWLRMFVPSYCRLARRLARLLLCESFRYLAVGPWAERDMKLVFRIFHPFATIARIEANLVKWGYFVEPSTRTEEAADESGRLSSVPIKMLWVGRMLDWKRVDTIIRAVRARRDVVLTLVGEGPERGRLERLAKGCPVMFLPPQPLWKIREIMREHDVYVLASNAQEGWGAALNEALEEGMLAVGTHEAGASAAILPRSCLFHAGDWRRLAALMEFGLTRATLTGYTLQDADVKLRELCEREG